jgi:hypothetical protein
LVSSNASRGGQQESRGADNKKATPVDAGDQWEDFFEATLIEGLEDEREQEQEEQIERMGRVGL